MNQESDGNSGGMFLVRKASGEEEPFDPSKLLLSLRNAGASDDIAETILRETEQRIMPDISTKQIYRLAFLMLRKTTTAAAMRYRIKQAMLELGPTGFPFERLTGKIFEKLGYEVRTGRLIEGYCIPHEIDVTAVRGNEMNLIECKYGQTQGKRVSVQTPLYVRSRVDDITKKYRSVPETARLTVTGWLITNTRLSADSARYGKCSGLKLIGWDYPKGEGLKDLIRKVNIYPVTVLTHLTKNEKQSLMNDGVVICSQILDTPEILAPFRMGKSKARALMKELAEICG